MWGLRFFCSPGHFNPAMKSIERCWLQDTEAGCTVQTSCNASGHSHGHALHNHPLIITCWRGLAHSTIKSGSEGSLKWECIAKGKCCLIYKNSLKHDFSEMYWKGKGRSASNQEWMLLQMVQTASVLLSFHISSNVIWIAFRNLILRTTAINTALVTHWMWESEDWLWVPLPVTWASVWTWSLPGHLSGHAFYDFHHDQRPWEHCCKEAHSFSHNQDPGFLWKWVLTENSHMCCPRQSLPRWPGKRCTCQLMCSLCSYAHCLPQAVLAER